MPRPSGSRGSRLKAEEQQLEKQREELMRKQQELERHLKKLPSVVEAREQKQRQLTRHRALVAAPAISPDIRPLGRRTRRNGPRRLPSSQLFQAQIKAIILLAIFIFVFILLWRSIPTH